MAHLVRVWCALWIQMSWNVIQVHYWIADLIQSENRAKCRVCSISTIHQGKSSMNKVQMKTLN